MGICIGPILVGDLITSACSTDLNPMSMTLQLPVYSINKPRWGSLLILKILSSIKDGKMRKRELIEQLEEEGVIDGHLS